MSDRFNLWKKVLVEQDEVEGEIDGEEIEGVEDEMEDTFFDLMVDFILNLPEDSVPEDMMATYNTLIAQIGDDYLGDDDEEDEVKFTPNDTEDEDEPIFSDDELKGESEDIDEEDDDELTEAWTPKKEEQYRKINQAVTDTFNELDKSKAEKGSKEWQKLYKKWKMAVKKAETFGEKNL